MPVLKIKKVKKEPFPIYPISNWGVSKYGVTLLINVDICQYLYNEQGSSLDVEDDEQGNFVGIGIYNPISKMCFYWSDWELAKQLTIPKFIAHNGISDVRKLQKWGFKIDDSWLLWDTQLMAHILDSSRRQFGLKALVKEELGMEYPSYEDITGKKTSKDHKTLDQLPVDLVSEYNAMDTYTTYKLYQKQNPVADGGLRVFQDFAAIKYFNYIEAPCAPIFHKMTERGIKVDLAYLEDLKDTLEASLLAVKLPLINELGSINLNAPKQVLTALKGKGITPVWHKKASMDKRGTLYKRWGYLPLIQNMAKYSELEALLSGFVYPYLERNEEIVHPEFRQTGTRTGRPSCRNPNLLNIPRRSENGKLVRRMFVARDGFMFGCCDYKEGEPRMLAHLSKDVDMCSLFNAGNGFHSYFAEKLNIDREKAKIFDLETYYRATKYGVANHLNCGLDQAQKYIDMAWSVFPNLYDWEQGVIYKAKKDGYVTTLMGRRIKIDGLDDSNEWRRAEAERQAMNNIAQGSLQEVMKLGMIAVDKAGIDIIVQVYDDILFESPEQGIQQDTQQVIDLLEHCVSLDIPMLVDSGIGKSWDACK